MTDPYEDREQTKAKHFILKSYLQALAFKILHFSDLTYVDGFSGPWKTVTKDLRDSSFMIAIAALKDAQQKIFEQTGKRRRVRCFFSESNLQAFEKLQEAVGPYDQPENLFEVQTYYGQFEDAVPEIRRFVGDSFALIFIDPTGWSGYPFEKIHELFAPRKCEVLINFMYSFVRRFIDADDEHIIESLNPILGGPGWRDRLDPKLPRGEALLMLFRETLKSSGNFESVVATKIDRPTEDRPHFIMAYATKDYAGLKTFRDIEFKALRAHAANRAAAKDRKKEAKTGSGNLFAEHDAEQQAASIEVAVQAELRRAKPEILEMVSRSGPLPFTKVAAVFMERYILRELNVKDAIVQLAREGRLENTWGSGNRKPKNGDEIRLKAPSV